MHRVDRSKTSRKKLNKRKNKITGNIGIAHTRWATHGEPTNQNAHPHISKNSIGVVHNGIIENYIHLKNLQIKQGYEFTSETDTEVIAHAIDFSLKSSNSLLEAVQKALKTLDGSYGLGIISSKYPGTIIASRKGSPLLIGIGRNGNYIASDQMALLSVTKKFIFLEDGDVAELKLEKITIYDKDGYQVVRPIKISKIKEGQVDLGDYKHFMQKEIFEQPQSIRDTLESRITKENVVVSAFGNKAKNVFKKIRQVQIVACGTSFNSGLVAKYWLEDIAKIPCNVEVASEYRYRHPIILDETLFVTISQSGETADTLEALKIAKKINNKIYTLCICNSAESSITRESDLTFLTHAGPEIGVASTKAFTTQLVALALLTCSIGVIKKNISIVGSEILIMGLTFKENCPDLRNTRVIDLIREFESNNCHIDVYDPWVNKAESFHEYGLTPIDNPINGKYDVIVLTVAHDEFKSLTEEQIRAYGKDNHVLYDIKYLLKERGMTTIGVKKLLADTSDSPIDDPIKSLSDYEKPIEQPDIDD